MDEQSQSRATTTQGRDLTSWMVGCAVGAAAVTGIVILVFLVALALQPPTWVQVLLGGLLAVGGAIFAWLVASAWRHRDRSQQARSQQERSPDT